MSKFEGQTFKNEAIKLDGNEYTNCTFEKCELIYAGYGSVSLAGNEFIGCKWTFIDSAQRTIQFMTALYHGGAKELIEKTIENIRKSQHPDIGIH